MKRPNGFKQLQEKRWFKILTNKFALATLAFVVWMLFLDVNSYLIHHELNTEIKELEESIDHYETEIAHDKKKLEELTTDPEKLEKFAREEYWLKKENEEIYLIR